MDNPNTTGKHRKKIAAKEGYVYIRIKKETKVMIDEYRQIYGLKTYDEAIQKMFEMWIPIIKPRL